MGEKICRMCGQSDVKFSTNKKNTDGLDTRCNGCRHRVYEQRQAEYQQRARDRYAKNRGEILTTKAEKYKTNRDEILVKRRQRWRANPKVRASREAYHAKQKSDCFALLGGVCVGCGQSNSNLLNIDHIHNDGSTERVHIKSHIKLWRKIIKEGPCDRYQLLCFNCSFKKWINLEPVELTGQTKKCPTCVHDIDFVYFKHDKKYRDGYYYECKICSRKRDSVVKQLAFLRLGSSCCIGCGIDDIDVLTVDHISNDGHRNRHTDGLGVSLHRKIISGSIDRSRFQVLCLNCNIKKSQGSIDTIKLPKMPEFERVQSLDFSLDDINILHINVDEAVKFLDEYHYAGYGRAATIIYGAYLHGQLIGVSKFCPPVRLEVATSLGLSYSSVLELDRFCIHPKFHKKNFGSYFLSHVQKLVKPKFSDITHLVSFADPEYGHTGTLYKSSNWKCIGKTSRSYVYVDPAMNIIHKKTVYNAAKTRNLTEREYAELMEYRKSYTVQKIKFVYELR